MKTFSRFLFSLPLFFIFATPAAAIYVKTGDNLTLDSSKYDQTVVVAGNQITVNSDINGDLICAGKNITISGKVTGDIICAGQTVNTSSDTNGNIRLAAQTINISGKIGKNISAAGQTITLLENTTLSGDLFFAGQTINLAGTVGRDAVGGGESVYLNGIVNRDTTLGFKTVSFSSQSLIKGNLDYYVSKDSNTTVNNQNIKGQVNKHEVEEPKVSTERKQQLVEAKQQFINFGKIFWFVSQLLLALVIVLLFRQFILSGSLNIISSFWSTLGIGFATLIGTPILALVLALTVFGLPLAGVTLLLYIASFIFSGIFSGAALGKVILVSRLKQKQLSPVLYTLAGVLTLMLVSKIPFIGWLIGFVSFTVGIGSFTRSIFARK